MLAPSPLPRSRPSLHAPPPPPAAAPCPQAPWAKRLLDLACVLPGLLLVAPALALIAVAIRLDSPGPVLFRQERVGQGGRPFRMLKFRTMRVEAAPQGAALLTVGQDPRITRVGRLLRELKLDELPQLLNVLRGEMSLVGPRPEVGRYIERYTPAQRRVLALRPGITSPASLAYRDEAALLATFEDPEHAYVTQLMPHKIQLHLDYAAQASTWSDLQLLLRTLTCLLRP